MTCRIRPTILAHDRGIRSYVTVRVNKPHNLVLRRPELRGIFTVLPASGCSLKYLARLFITKIASGNRCETCQLKAANGQADFSKSVSTEARSRSRLTARRLKGLVAERRLAGGIGCELPRMAEYRKPFVWLSLSRRTSAQQTSALSTSNRRNPT